MVIIARFCRTFWGKIELNYINGEALKRFIVPEVNISSESDSTNTVNTCIFFLCSNLKGFFTDLAQPKPKIEPAVVKK